MAESDDKKKRTEEIAHLIGEAIIVSMNRPDSGQPALTEEEKEEVKKRVSNAFNLFLEHHEWKDKTDPVLSEFRKASIPKLLKQKLLDKDHGSMESALKDAFPTLDPEFEGHAILNLIAHMACAGPFRKIKESTLAKIVEDEYTIAGLVIMYLHWRVQSTTPPKEEQH